MNYCLINQVTAESHPSPGFWIKLFLCISVFRGDRRGDLRHRVRIGDNGQIHLQQERDVSKPGSQSSAAWRRTRVALQQPGGLSERSQWKPKGVFHLAGAPTSHWPDRTEWDDSPRAQCFTRHTQPLVQRINKMWSQKQNNFLSSLSAVISRM